MEQAPGETMIMSKILQQDTWEWSDIQRSILTIQ